MNLKYAIFLINLTLVVLTTSVSSHAATYIEYEGIEGHVTATESTTEKERRKTIAKDLKKKDASKNKASTKSKPKNGSADGTVRKWD